MGLQEAACYQMPPGVVPRQVLGVDRVKEAAVLYILRKALSYIPPVCTPEAKGLKCSEQEAGRLWNKADDPLHGLTRKLLPSVVRF